MNWFTIALAFISLCNLIFLIGAAYLLYKIVGATETAQEDLLKAARQNMDGGHQLMTMARRSINDMVRINDAQAARENSSSRVIAELSRQIRSLASQVQSGGAPAREKALSTPDDAAADAIEEDLRAKLRANLNVALAKNNQLQDEIEQTKYRLKDASFTNSELRQELTELKGLKQSVVDSLMQRTTELEEQLQKARERAHAAEQHAELNTVQLDDIREQIKAQAFSRGADQSGLIESQQQQIDLLAAREKELLARLEAMEQAFNRNQTEKEFIEERFLQIDSRPNPPE